MISPIIPLPPIFPTFWMHEDTSILRFRKDDNQPTTIEIESSVGKNIVIGKINTFVSNQQKYVSTVYIYSTCQALDGALLKITQTRQNIYKLRYSRGKLKLKIGYIKGG